MAPKTKTREPTRRVPEYTLATAIRLRLLEDWSPVDLVATL